MSGTGSKRQVMRLHIAAVDNRLSPRQFLHYGKFGSVVILLYVTCSKAFVN